MKIQDLFTDFYSATSTLSTQVRYVNYSLIAVCWILSGQAVSGIKEGYSTVLLYIVLSLALDIFQYLWQSIATWTFIRPLEKKEVITKEVRDDYLFPRYIFNVTWLFFSCKVICALIAVILLIIKLLN